MNFLDRLKKLFKSVSTYEAEVGNSLDIAFIHEDDQCQIELSPAENLEYLTQECRKIEDFSKEHFDGHGSTEIYVRKRPPTELTNRKISLDEFSKSFIELGFVKKNLRFFGFPKSDFNQFVLEKEKVNIYYGYSGNFVNSIYFNGHVTEKEKPLFTSVLLTLSKSFDLVLVDWNLEELFDTRNELEIDRFYNRYN